MSDSQFYENAARYWSKIPATIDGILGGYGHISDLDIKGSRIFLSKIFSLENAPSRERALDCGAGIGRITKNLLIPVFQTVDMVELDEKFIDAAKELIGSDKRLGCIYQTSLQTFQPTNKYDIIWCQWVLGHLNDYDLVTFLQRCKKSLNENGVIIIKENIASGDVIEYDEDDSSVTRPYNLMMKIFEETKLQPIMENLQTDFPKDIYDVFAFALKPLAK